MGLRQSISSDTEESHVDDGSDLDEETNTSEEKPMLTTFPKRIGKSVQVNDQILMPDTHQEIVLKFQKLQMDNIIEERNHSERIIREKEKLLKEKEETIRQQANLIKTQNELLGQRKQRNMTNTGSEKGQYDVNFKSRSSRPLTKPTQFLKSVTSLENIQANGQDYRRQASTESKYDKTYSGAAERPTRSKQSTQIFKTMPSPANSDFTYRTPFQRDSRSSTSVVPYQPMYYAPKSDYNVPSSSNSNGIPTNSAGWLARGSQTFDYRKLNSKSDNPRGENSGQSTSELLQDLEKQTSYEVQKLNNHQNDGDRLIKQENGVPAIVKCTRCRVARKSKTTPVGVTHKCKKCGNYVDNRVIKRSCKSDDESRSHIMWTADSEVISDVD